MQSSEGSGKIKLYTKRTTGSEYILPIPLSNLLPPSPLLIVIARISYYCVETREDTKIK